MSCAWLTAGTARYVRCDWRLNIPAADYADDLSATVRYALETTRAIVVYPFHCEVSIRMGDDAAESHAFERSQDDRQE
jgi:hypothetical protein